MMSVKNVTSYLKVCFTQYVCQVSSQSIAAIYPKKSMVEVIPPSFSPRQRSRGLNTSVGIGLTELAKLTDTLNYKLLFKYCILPKNLFTKYFVYICFEQNLFFLKLGCILHVFDYIQGEVQCYGNKGSVVIFV